GTARALQMNAEAGAFAGLAMGLNRRLVAQIKREFKQKLIMPALTLVAAMVVVLIFVLKVIPTLGDLMASLGVEMNIMTYSLIVFAGFLGNYGLVAAGISVVVVIGYQLMRQRWREVRQLESEILMRMPRVNRYLAQFSVYQWIGTYALLQAAGLPNEALTLSAESVSNPWFRERFAEAADQTMSGAFSSIAAAISEVNPVLHRQTTFFQTLNTYLDTGQTAILDSYRQELEGKLQSTLKSMVELVNPLMTAALGLVVGYIVVAFYLPLTQIVGGLAK
ncbi:MAG: type II secretion system F family protein, partial [Chloracidobacterium sp.]